MLDESCRALEQENSWRRETLARLEQENAWRRDTMAMLGESCRALVQEVSWRRDTMALLEESCRTLEREVTWRRETLTGLEQENAWRRGAMARLQENCEQQAAVLGSAIAAHERLLRHHRDVIARVAAESLAVAKLPWWRWRVARRRLAALAALLRQELP
jgi:protease II